MKIIYVCHDCRGYNKHQRDAESFEERDTEFISLTDAVVHINATGHWVDAVVREEA